MAGPGDRSGLAVAGRRTGEGLAGRERIIRQIEPRPQEEAAWSGGVSPRPTVGVPDGVPRPLAVPDGAIDIMDLPQAGSGRSTRFPSSGSAVRLVSGTEEIDGSSGGQTPGDRRSTTITGGPNSRFSSRARYGYDPNYEWLRGKLEYSQIERRWKLRYIPIDGSTDEFGGSVVFSDASLLAGYERGEFVEVRGRLSDVAPGDGGYAPDFKIREIERTGT